MFYVIHFHCLSLISYHHVSGMHQMQLDSVTQLSSSLQIFHTISLLGKYPSAWTIFQGNLSRFSFIINTFHFISLLLLISSVQVKFSRELFSFQ